MPKLLTHKMIAARKKLDPNYVPTKRDLEIADQHKKRGKHKTTDAYKQKQDPDLALVIRECGNHKCKKRFTPRTIRQWYCKPSCRKSWNHARCRNPDLTVHTACLADRLLMLKLKHDSRFSGTHAQKLESLRYREQGRIVTSFYPKFLAWDTKTKYRVRSYPLRHRKQMLRDKQ